MRCLIEECPKNKRVRGLCVSHYIALGKAVKQGRTTFAQLEQFGMILPASRIQKGLAEKMLEKSFKRLKKEE
jgi:hypothetical protein